MAAETQILNINAAFLSSQILPPDSAAASIFGEIPVSADVTSMTEPLVAAPRVPGLDEDDDLDEDDEDDYEDDDELEDDKEEDEDDEDDDDEYDDDEDDDDDEDENNDDDDEEDDDTLRVLTQNF